MSLNGVPVLMYSHDNVDSPVTLSPFSTSPAAPPQARNLDEPVRNPGERL